MPAPEGPAPNTVRLSSRWAYKLVLQVMLRRGIQSDKGPFPVATTVDKTVNLQTLQYHQDARWPHSDALPCPLVTQKQAMHRNCNQLEWRSAHFSSFGFWKPWTGLLGAAAIIH